MATPYKPSIDVPAAQLADITAGGIPSGRAGSYLLAICNRTANPITYRVAVTTGGAATLADFVVYDFTVGANDIERDWPIPLGDGFKVFVYASAAGLSASLHVSQRA